MKLQELNTEQQQEINGGTSNSVDISITSTTDSLLSITMHTKMGDKETTRTIAAGNDVDASLNAWAKGTG